MDVYTCRVCISCMVLLFTVSSAVAHESSALTIDIPPKDRVCFYEKFKDMTKMVFSYEVIGGGELDIDVRVESPNGMPIYESDQEEDDTFTFESTIGVHSFCFSNQFSLVSNKLVYFALHPEGHAPLLDEAGIKRPSANTQFEETMESIHVLTNNVQSYQNNYRLDETKGRYIAQSLNARVLIWSLTEAILIVVMGCGQVAILRRFFVNVPTVKDDNRGVEGHLGRDGKIVVPGQTKV